MIGVQAIDAKSELAGYLFRICLPELDRRLPGVSWEL